MKVTETYKHAMILQISIYFNYIPSFMILLKSFTYLWVTPYVCKYIYEDIPTYIYGFRYGYKYRYGWRRHIDGGTENEIYTNIYIYK